MSIDRGKDKDVVHIYNGILLSIKEGNNAIYSNMNGPRNYHTFLVSRDIKRHLRSLFGEGNGTPLQYSCLENPRDRGALWAAIYGVTQSPI